MENPSGSEQVWFTESSTLERGEYDPDLQTLDLWFRVPSQRYQYVGVPREVWTTLCAAPSPGSAFHSLIRGKYEGMRL